MKQLISKFLPHKVESPVKEVIEFIKENNITISTESFMGVAKYQVLNGFSLKVERGSHLLAVTLTDSLGNVVELSKDEDRWLLKQLQKILKERSVATKNREDEIARKNIMTMIDNYKYL